MKRPTFTAGKGLTLENRINNVITSLKCAAKRGTELLESHLGVGLESVAGNFKANRRRESTVAATFIFHKRFDYYYYKHT